MIAGPQETLGRVKSELWPQKSLHVLSTNDGQSINPDTLAHSHSHFVNTDFMPLDFILKERARMKKKP